MRDRSALCRSSLLDRRKDEGTDKQTAEDGQTRRHVEADKHMDCYMEEDTEIARQTDGRTRRCMDRSEAKRRDSGPWTDRRIWVDRRKKRDIRADRRTHRRTDRRAYRQVCGQAGKRPTMTRKKREYAQTDVDLHTDGQIDGHIDRRSKSQRWSERRRDR